MQDLSYSELAELTHTKQVELFNFCMCEDLQDGQEAPYSDCLKEER
jgi:hypothetical protein